MKNLLRFSFVAVIALLLTGNSFSKDFEGIIKMEITSPKMGDSKMILTTYIDDDMSMTEMTMPQGGNMKIYMNQKTHKSTMVMEAMKMGMEMDMSSAIAAKTSNDNIPTIEATAERKVISDHNCQLYRVTMKNGDQSNWWMTDEVPASILSSLKNIFNNSGASSMKKQGPGKEAIEEMFKKGLVPIRIETMKDGKPETTITFVKFEKKDLDDSIFKIPEDIKIQQMPAGMGGMGGQ